MNNVCLLPAYKLVRNAHLARDRALQVDTVIGMAPLLELDLREDEAAAESDAVLSPAVKRAATVVLALLPWRFQNDKRTDVIDDRIGR